MSLFTVNPDLCHRDGICVATCPIGIIEMKDKDAVPTPTPEAEGLCINCGHCFAVCPHGALELATMNPDDCRSVQKDLSISTEQMVQFLSSRRSIRRYKDQTVPRETLEQLLDVAAYAPSGHNTQPVEWLVIQDPAEVQRLAGIVADWMRFMIKEQPDVADELNLSRVVAAWDHGMDKICRGAPHIIIAMANKNQRTAPASAPIALSYLELAAYGMGLGACWAGYFNLALTFFPPMKEALNWGRDMGNYGALLIGVPQYRYQRIPLRNKPRATWR